MNLYLIKKINGESVYVVASTMIEALQYVEHAIVCETIATKDIADCNLNRLIVAS